MNQYDLLNQLLQVPGGEPVQAPLLPKDMLVSKARMTQSMPAPQQNVASPILAITNPKVPMTDSVFKQLIDRQTEGLKAQRAGVGELENEYKAYKDSMQGMNPIIAGTFALNDLFNNSNTLQNYMLKQRQDQEQALKLAAGVQEARNKVTDNEINLLKNQYQHEEDQSRMRLTRELGFAKLDDKPEKPKELKDWQVQSATFGRRIEQAEKVFSDLEKEGYNRASFGEGLKDMASGIWGVGHLTPEKLKRQQQAERNFVNAVLRRESGAAIASSEFKNAEQQYFPRAGDTPEVIEQKRANRMQVLEGLRVGGGPAWDAIAPVTPQAPIAPKSPSEDPGFLEWKKSKGL